LEEEEEEEVVVVVVKVGEADEARWGGVEVGVVFVVV
jgi:hypothetical protein